MPLPSSPPVPSPPPAAPAARALDLQGHRGARGLCPENTLRAFARALGLGVTTLEMDLGVTKDGVVVVSHDAQLNPDLTRAPDGRWLEAPGPALRELTFDELLRYDVGRLKPGSAYAARFPQQEGADGVRVPSFAQVAALARRAGNQRVRFNVETKLDPRQAQRTLPPEAFADAVVAAVRQAGLVERTSIQSFDWRTLARVRTKAPEIATVALTLAQGPDDNIQRGRPGPSPWLAGLDADDFPSVPALVKASGAAVWSPFHGDVTPALVAEAQSLGLVVLPWTVNEPEVIERLLDARVDGLIGDYPERLRAAAARRGHVLPEPTPVVP